MKICRPAALLLIASVVLAPAPAGAWGGDVHRLINRTAVDCLPAPFAGFAQWSGDLERLATDADRRKSYTDGEAERHYIDIDDYPEFFAGTLPHSLPAMIALYGWGRVQDNGIAPWAIEETYRNLVGAFETRNWTRAVAMAADIGHYVGDIHNPLHLTLNYDGQLTRQWGVHSRFESELTDRYLSRIIPSPRPAVAVPPVLETVFDWIDGLYPGVQIVLAADKAAKAEAGGSTDSDRYFEVFWEEAGQYAVFWIGEASVAVASLWYTAWVEAGSPALPGSASARRTTVGELKRLYLAP